MKEALTEERTRHEARIAELGHEHEEPADPLAGRGHLRPGLRVGKDIMKIA